MIIGVAMALVMHQALRWRGIVRAGILVPWAIPTAVSAILWQWIFQADGVANAIIGSQVLWTTEGWQAKVAVMIADTWKTAPFIGLLVLAGLQIIPRDIYEAARVDGVGPVRQFWSITLPLSDRYSSSRCCSECWTRCGCSTCRSSSLETARNPLRH
ncbi:carbohydrate ABC transporter permease [Kibdelosporangium philippinense]|uniref:carbohydrate ABC transporter permease n=1 Tax=Kibdelosporangium philippinense TaxID=211113 RepID=UPI00361B3D67